MSQYQRAVTPTLDGTVSSGIIRGKVLSYSSTNNQGAVGNQNNSNGANGGGISGGKIRSLLNTSGGQSTGSQLNTSTTSPYKFNPVSSYGITSNASQDFNIQGRGATNRNAMPPQIGQNMSNFKLQDLSAVKEQITSSSILPRYDLIPISEDLPADGIIFARVKNQADSLVVFRTPEERIRNPERLNLDRRQLDICPVLEQEQRLRLLNFQNNNIRSIQHLENLPNLIFLDLYNNKIVTLDGPLSLLKGLRVLMAGKNRITAISNLTNLKKMDVLDLHSNDIRTIEGLENLSELRVLNLAG